ncbi:hypothetical protein RHGRI_015108 [Rhododendron griersonianum]|uniref:GST N-terminal domain-containing protein n=1 Tax=Rhododendron griersonianum TaxID=479676 RepID=A0AAV6KCG8_9ERIC|nr:hypothetical protein RHGRI_015108 [Rhododendron griersonianum]
MATPYVKEDLPPYLDSTSEQPPLFDGTTRLYTYYQCPFAQRVWIARNYKGLQDEIKLVPIDLKNRPAWYKEKVYPENKDPLKQQFAEELLAYTDTLNKIVYTSFKGDAANEAGSAFDYLETALHKFEDGPFFLGQFSLVDIAYAPFVERFQIFLQDVWKYDITAGRPKLATWIEEVNKIDAYKPTKGDPEFLIQNYRQRFLGQ